MDAQPNAPEPAPAELLENAREAAEHSYSPYSGFKVGAALRLTNGQTVTGANVENVSYGLTICAERAALVRAVAQFGPDIRIAAVAVANLNGGGKSAVRGLPAGAGGIYFAGGAGGVSSSRRSADDALLCPAAAGVRDEAEVRAGKGPDSCPNACSPVATVPTPQVRLIRDVHTQYRYLGCPAAHD